jgi:hypothetical protein
MNYIHKANIPGDIVECEVWRHGSAMVIASELKEFNCTEKKIWLYDTFQGMTRSTEFDVEAGSNISAFELLSENILVTTINIMFPINIIGLLISKILSKNDDFYLDNVVLARKIKLWK